MTKREAYLRGYEEFADAPRASLALHPLSLLLVVLGLGLVVWGLWAWGQAGSWSWTQGASRPDILAAGIRCGAAAAIAAGEALWIGGVVNRVYEQDGFGRLLQWTATGAMLIALVSALALGWAGR